MPSSSNTYLVTQATGEQGKLVITHLLAAGAQVHAVVRDITKAPALLKSPGVTLFQGESKTYSDILAAARGCKGASLNTFPIPGLETLQAKTIIDACKEAGVESLVACTTYMANHEEKWSGQEAVECQLDGYFQSKAQVEDLVRASGIGSYTILRPAILYQDFYLPGLYGNYPKLSQGVLDHAFDDDTKLIFTDANDIGRYAAAALLDPARFSGQEIDVASNIPITISEVHKLLVKVTGRDITLHKRSPAEVDEAKEAVFGQRFQLWPGLFDDSDVVASSMEAAHAKFGINFTSLEEALRRDQERLAYLSAQ